jgi:hypothetical protein
LVLVLTKGRTIWFSICYAVFGTCLHVTGNHILVKHFYVDTRKVDVSDLLFTILCLSGDEFVNKKGE